MIRTTLRSSVAALALLACTGQSGIAQTETADTTRKPIKTIIVRRSAIQQTAGAESTPDMFTLEPTPAPPALGDSDSAKLYLHPAPAASLPPRTPVRHSPASADSQVQMVSQEDASGADESGPKVKSLVTENGTAVVPLYPQTNSPMYPCPQPYIPYQVGGTAITNQALAPHEMLYPHTYRAMYGPYYYKVRGGWFLSPFGVRSYETWRLQGTEVEVKYHSRISHRARFASPLLFH